MVLSRAERRSTTNGIALGKTGYSVRYENFERVVGRGHSGSRVSAEGSVRFARIL